MLKHSFFFLSNLQLTNYRLLKHLCNCFLFFFTVGEYRPTVGHVCGLLLVLESIPYYKWAPSHSSNALEPVYDKDNVVPRKKFRR